MIMLLLKRSLALKSLLSACGLSPRQRSETPPAGPDKTPFPPEAALLPCGERIPAIAELCSKCYRMRRHSRDYFGGNRETVLARDHFRCASCGEASLLHVHHRHPGNSDPDLLITVCSACHARLHRLASIHVWIPELLAILWAEQHPTTPVQLQLSFGAEG
jgi:hypothetical protein